MSYSHVNAYRRKDGTAVRSHQRIKSNEKNNNSSSSRRQSPESLALNLETVSDIKQVSSKEIAKQYLDFRKKYFGKEGIYNISNIVDGKSGASIFAGSTAGIIATLGFGAAPLGLAALAVGLVPTIARFVKYVKDSGDPAAAFSKQIKKTGEFEVSQEDRQLMKAASESNGWKTKPSKYKSEIDGTKATSKVDKNGFGTVEGEMLLPMSMHEENLKVPFHINFFPGVNFSKEHLIFDFNLPGVNMENANMSSSFTLKGNLSGANLKNSDWTDANIGEVNFDGANLEGANLHLAGGHPYRNGTGGPSMRGANLRNANLTQAHLFSFDLAGADFTGADLTGAALPQDLKGINITDEQFGSLAHFGSHLSSYNYEKKTFQETIEELGISEKQFEFLVISGAIKVRDNSESKLVEGNFNPSLHHIPIWEIEKAKKTLPQLG